jgi:ATP-binding cassette subfamily G (WHITE) protein 2 (PDR)
MTIIKSHTAFVATDFVVQRALYEARERPAKTYSWQAFMVAQILVELPWQVSLLVLLCMRSAY